MKDKPVYIILASVLITATLVFAGVVVGSKLGSVPSGIGVANPDQGAEALPVNSLDSTPGVGTTNDGIAIPGFEKLSLKADQLIQNVGFYNPEQNSCYFRIFFTLADGTMLYQSGMVKPGQSLDTVELFRPLKTGTYEGAILRYECYSVDALQPLNGAETILKLEVLP